MKVIRSCTDRKILQYKDVEKSRVVCNSAYQNKMDFLPTILFLYIYASAVQCDCHPFTSADISWQWVLCQTSVLYSWGKI